MAPDDFVIDADNNNTVVDAHKADDNNKSVVDAHKGSDSNNNNNKTSGKTKRWLSKSGGKYTHVVDGRRVKPSVDYFHTKDFDQVFVPGRHNTLKPAPVSVKRNRHKDPVSLMKIKPRERVDYKIREKSRVGKKQRRRQRYAQNIKEAKERYRLKMEHKLQLESKPRQEPPKKQKKFCISQSPRYPKTFTSPFVVNVISESVDDKPFYSVFNYRQKLRAKRGRLMEKIGLSDCDRMTLRLARKLQVVSDKLEALTDKMDFSFETEDFSHAFTSRWSDLGRRLRAFSFKATLSTDDDVEHFQYSDNSVCYTFNQLKRMAHKKIPVFDFDLELTSGKRKLEVHIDESNAFTKEDRCSQAETPRQEDVVAGLASVVSTLTDVLTAVDEGSEGDDQHLLKRQRHDVESRCIGANRFERHAMPGLEKASQRLSVPSRGDSFVPNISSAFVMADIFSRYTAGEGAGITQRVKLRQPDVWPSGKKSFARVYSHYDKSDLTEFFENSSDAWWRGFAMDKGILSPAEVACGGVPRDINPFMSYTELPPLTGFEREMIDHYLTTQQAKELKALSEIELEDTAGEGLSSAFLSAFIQYVEDDGMPSKKALSIAEDYALFFTQLYYSSKHAKPMDRFVSAFTNILSLYKMRNSGSLLCDSYDSILGLLSSWGQDGFISDESSVETDSNSGSADTSTFTVDEISALIDRTPNLAELFQVLVHDDLPVEYMKGKSVKPENMGGIDFSSGVLAVAHSMLSRNTQKRLAFANLVFNERGKNVSLANKHPTGVWIPELGDGVFTDCSGVERSESDFIKFFKPISDLVYSICALICLPAAGWSFKDALHDHAKRLFFLNNFFSATDLLSLFVDGLKFVMQRVYHFTDGCSSNLAGWDWTALFESKPADHVKLMSDIIALRKGVSMKDSMPNPLPPEIANDETISWAFDLEKSQDMCVSILDRLEVFKKFWTFRNNKKMILETDATIADIRIIRNDLLIHISSTLSRQVPLCYQFYGKSRIGKSFLIDQTHQAHCKGRQLPSGEWVKWVKPVGDPYNSGYKNKTETVVIDDIGAIKTKYEKELDITNILRLVNNAPCGMNQAAVQDKGNMHFTGGLVLLTSNDSNIGAADVMRYPEATFRRITPVKVELKPEWTLDDGTLNVHKYQTECEEAARVSIEQETRCVLPEPWTLVLMKFDKDSDVASFPYTQDRQLDTNDFLDHVHNLSRRHFADQGSISKAINAATDRKWETYEDVGLCHYLPTRLVDMGSRFKSSCTRTAADALSVPIVQAAERRIIERVESMTVDVNKLLYVGGVVLSVGVSFYALMRMIEFFRSRHSAAFVDTISANPFGEPIKADINKPGVSSVPVAAKTSGHNDTLSVRDMVAKNTVKLTQLRNGKVCLGSGLMIRSNVFVTARHVLDDFDLNSPLTISFKDGAGVSMNMDGYYVRCRPVQAADRGALSCVRDVAFGMIAGGMTMSRSDGVCASVHKSIEARIASRRGETDMRYGATVFTKYNGYSDSIEGIINKSFEFKHKGAMHTAILVKFCRPIEQGMSGSPVLFHDRNSNAYIGGIIMGRKPDDFTLATVVPFGEDDLNEACTYFDDQYDVEMCAQAVDLEADNVKPLSPSSIFSHFEKENVSGGGELIGFMDSTQTRRKSNDKDLIVPPYLSQVIRRYKCDPGYCLSYMGKHPWIAAMDVEMRSRRTAPPNFIRMCADSFVDQTLSKISQDESASLLLRSLGMVSEDVAVNGVEAVAYVNGSNMSSSAGYPYSGPKASLYDGKRPNATMKPELAARVERLRQAYRQGLSSGGLQTGQLKKEIRNLETFENKKNRVFTVVPVAQVQVQKELLMLFKRLIFSRRFLFETAMGYNSDSAESGDIVDYLKQIDNKFGKTPNLIAGDFSKFDKSFDPVVFVYFFYVVKRFHEASAMSREDFERWRVMWRGVQEDTTHGFCTYNGGIFRRMYGLASGLFFTTEAGCFYQSITKRSIFAICFYFARKLGKSLDDDEFWTGEFLEHYAPNITWDIVNDEGFNESFEDAMIAFNERVNLLHFGDDHVDSVIGCMLNGKLYQILYRNLFNMGYTDAEKSNEVPLFNDFEDMRFLKRKFSFDEELGEYVGTLPESSLQKMLSQRYQKNGTEYDGHKGAFESSQIEYYKFGREVYDDHLEFLRSLWAEHFPGLDVNFWTYDQQMERFSTSNFNISKAPQPIVVGGKLRFCDRWKKVYKDCKFFDPLEPDQDEEFEECVGGDCLVADPDRFVPADAVDYSFLLKEGHKKRQSVLDLINETDISTLPPVTCDVAKACYNCWKSSGTQESQLEVSVAGGKLFLGAYGVPLASTKRVHGLQISSGVAGRVYRSDHVSQHWLQLADEGVVAIRNTLQIGRASEKNGFDDVAGLTYMFRFYVRSHEGLWMETPVAVYYQNIGFPCGKRGPVCISDASAQTEKRQRVMTDLHSVDLDFEVELCSGSVEIDDGGIHQALEIEEHVEIASIPTQDSRSHTSLSQWDEFPIKMDIFETTGNSKLRAYYPFCALMNSQRVWDRVKEFRLVKPTIRLQVDVSGSSFNGGKLFISYFPGDSFNSRVPQHGAMASELCSVYHRSRMLEVEHIEIDLGTSSTNFMDVPLHATVDYVKVDSDFREFGVFTIYTIGVVNASEGKDPTVRLTLLVDGLEVSGRQPAARFEQKNVKLGDTEPGKMFVGLSAAVSEQLKSMSAIVAGSEARSVIGQNQGLGPVARDMASRLYKVDFENTSFKQYIETEGYLKSLRWTAGSSSDTWAFPVRPDTQLLVEGSNLDVPEVEASNKQLYKHSFLSMVASISKFWCGSIIYRVRVMKTSYHVGKLVFLHVPSGFDGDNTDYTEFPHVIVDIGVDSDFDIEVPYTKNSWSEVGADNGLLIFRPLMPLTSPNESPVDIMITNRAGDIRFGVPKTASGSVFYSRPTQDTFKAEPETFDETLGLKTSVPLFRIGPPGTVPVNNINSTITDFDQFMYMRQRCAYLKIAKSDRWDYVASLFPRRAKSMYSTYIHLISACHLAWKGTVNHFLTVCSDVQGVSRYCATSSDLYSKDSGVTTVNSQDGVMQVTTSYDCPVKFSHVDQRSSVTDHDPTSVHFYGESAGVRTYKIFHEISADKDFEFLVPVCAPYVFIDG